MRRGAAVSDEGAAAAAEAAGESGHRLQIRPHLYAVEPAISLRIWREVPMLYFRTLAPTCEACGERVHWLGGPAALQLSGLLAYRVRCACGEDEITVDWPLRVAGTAAWWDSGAWKAVGQGDDEAEEQRARQAADDFVAAAGQV